LQEKVFLIVAGRLAVKGEKQRRAQAQIESRAEVFPVQPKPASTPAVRPTLSVDIVP